MNRNARNYVHKDFSYLINNKDNNGYLNGGSYNNRLPKKVNNLTPAKRRKVLLENPRMLFAYSASNKLLHDRSCDYVKTISNNNFRMVAQFPVWMDCCPVCYRRAVVRAGARHDQIHFEDYMKLLDLFKASDEDLYNLIIVNNASLKLVDEKTLQVRVRDDTWRVIRVDRGVELWHNNYIKLDDCSRTFVKGFHKQTVYGRNTFHNVLQVLLGYSWDRHVEMFKRADEARNDVQSTIAKDKKGQDNDLSLNRDSFVNKICSWIRKLFYKIKSFMFCKKEGVDD